MDDVKKIAITLKDEFKSKANHNKNESLFCFIMILTCSLSAPLFITLGKGDVLEKVTPSILSVFSAGCTSWLQLRKPQRLWSVYRSAQRLIENELFKHEFMIDDYASTEHADKKLIEKVIAIRMTAHNSWDEIVPVPEGMSTLINK